jgi:hypothetical protein
MEKLVNFAKSLLTNRLGIVLATLNLCYFLSRDAFRLVFAHEHSDGSGCFFSRHHPGILFGHGNFDAVMLFQNSPAFIASLISGEFARFLFSGFCGFTYQKLWLILLVFFVALQWLFIARTAKTIAQKLKAD